MKRIKYPSTAIVRDKLGADSAIAKRIYALERWAVRHGYDGHHAHTVPTKKDKIKQQKIRF